MAASKETEAAFLELAIEFRPTTQIIVEQPASTWLWKQAGLPQRIYHHEHPWTDLASQVGGLADLV